MLTVDKVVKYIRRKLGAPFLALEFDSETIKEFILEDALSKFTEYVPDVNTIVIDTTKSSNKVDSKIKNKFWIKDPDERQVLSVVNVSYDHNVYLSTGYPYFMPFTSAAATPDLALSMANSDIARQYSKSDLTWWQERNLNQIWIYAEDSLAKLYGVTYTRTHSEDLSTIPEEYANAFCQLCTAIIMQSIGEIRSKYSSLNTPIGDISIDNSIQSRGDSLYDKVVEDLKSRALIFSYCYIG